MGSNCVELHPGIYRIVLPMKGNRPGPVNAYLFAGKNVTLLDTGLAATGKVLLRALAEKGLSFEDIDQVVLTHGHIDHFGAARAIVKAGRGRAKVYAHTEDVAAIERGYDTPPAAVSRFFRGAGMPALYRLAVRLLFSLFRFITPVCPVDVHLQDNDILHLGDYRGRVVSTPGHSRGSICIHLEELDILFSGDHVLGHITPNAFVMLEEYHEIPRRMSQAEYYSSLARVEKISPDTVYPAHGKAIHDLSSVTEGYRRSFRERQEAILSVLGAEPMTVYAVARALFPAIQGRRFVLEIFLAVSEVYTHLQILERDGRVACETSGGVEIYRAL